MRDHQKLIDRVLSLTPGTTLESAAALVGDAIPLTSDEEIPGSVRLGSHIGNWPYRFRLTMDFDPQDRMMGFAMKCRMLESWKARALYEDICAGLADRLKAPRTEADGERWGRESRRKVWPRSGYWLCLDQPDPRSSERIISVGGTFTTAMRDDADRHRPPSLEDLFE